MNARGGADTAIILARMMASRAAGVRDYRVEVRRVGLDGSMVRDFSSLLDAQVAFNREMRTARGDVARLVLSVRDDDGRWVPRSTKHVDRRTRHRDHELTMRVQPRTGGG